MKAQQNCSVVHKNGLVFLLYVYADYINPCLVEPDQTIDSNSIDTANRTRVYLEEDGWAQIGAGQGEEDPNLHYWHFTRTITY